MGWDSIALKAKIVSGRKITDSSCPSIASQLKAARDSMDQYGKKSNAAMGPWDSQQEEKTKKKSISNKG